MDISLFFKGFLIGLVVAMPLGPIGILSVKRTFADGYLTGLFSGLGISTADAIYSGMAIFGVQAISGFLITEALWFRLMGGAIICLLGVQIYARTGCHKISTHVNHRCVIGAFFSALMLTLMNPALIISFTAIFASLGPAMTNTSGFENTLLVAGVFWGSAIWWVILSSAVRRLKSIFTDSLILKINHLSGVLITGFGLFIIGSALL